MVVKKKSSRKVVRVVRKKKALKVKKGTKKLIKRKGAKVSKPIPYEIIRVAKIPNEVLNKIKSGDKEWREQESDALKHWYYGDNARYRRWFDWSSDSFKIISELNSFSDTMTQHVRDNIPKEYHIHLSTLIDAHASMRGQLNEVLNRLNDIRRSIFYYHGEDIGIKLDDLVK